MRTVRSLPVIMPVVSNQRWSCHSCGHCCRTLVGHLFEEERARIDRQDWDQELGGAPYVRVGRGFVLNKRADGSCVFLDENNRCLIHAKYGEEAKPLACLIFPFSVRPVRHGWQVSFRFDCPSAARSKGEPIGHYRSALAALVQTLDHHPPRKDDLADLPGRLRATVEEIDAVLSHYTRWVKREDLAVMDRLIGAARITATLQQAKLKQVRANRFAELLDLLFKALPADCANKPDSSTQRQKGMLRQLAFAHAEHVSLAELRSGIPGRWRKRWQQLRNARKFRVGIGPVPPLPGFTTGASFAGLESIAPAADPTDELEDLLVRYLATRLASRSVFGAGYYGWPVASGLTALGLSVAAAGWLARYAAAATGRTAVAFEDFALALGSVDRAATRLPSLGTAAERTRARYLSDDDGVARLLYDYTPVGRRK